MSEARQRKDELVTEETFCTYQWDGNPQEPCECMKIGGHESPHRCFCGQEADL